MGKTHAGTGHWIARGFARGREMAEYLKLLSRIEAGSLV
jgi:hypothetical protein